MVYQKQFTSAYVSSKLRWVFLGLCFNTIFLYLSNNVILWFIITLATTSSAAMALSIEGTRVQIHVLPFQNLGNFVHLTLPVSFGRDTKNCWALLPGVCAREVKYLRQGVNA